MNYALVGYGRMGRAIDREARSRGHRRVATVSASGEPAWAEVGAAADVAFEFTEPDSAEANVLRLLQAGLTVVCGTTGWEPGPRVVEAAARNGALMVAPNFSLGVHLFFRVAAHAAALVGAAGLHQPFIEERHHRGKRDVPSGTARRLAAIVAASDPRRPSVVEGHASGGLDDGVVQVVGLRAGHEPGLHRVGFDGAHDCLTLEHRARGREGFASGAVTAAEWLAGRRGRHSIEEMMDAILAPAVSAGGTTKEDRRA